ncbi:SusD/RagB family nutrient-binding outer membrane lipoprotein [Arenibacter sp. 6A1]|uniref:SusD/RagB family nutrient-binding outer membrane lipoprotein n=1 Tax=Arenibacter sp. 6A1 TaxID=2720391 RepID=UPI0014456532|nr:SusD/RagB family nutrient-binding outer membrane lipoprotein [Arenibacter sp. 6A1]NKI26924.1 SusD/RagB family nutrient-binding outer membrane lipoprotein [Arenibacter sp. 6A1]
MKIYTIVAFLIVVLLTGACTQNFDEIAKNPNSPEQVIPSLLFTNLALDVAGPSYGKNLFTEPLVVRQIVWTEAIESAQYYYFNRAGFGGYNSMRNVQKMIQEAERAENDVYKGLGYFFNAWYFYDMTMAFGDIPYADALKGETGEEYSPKYDPQEEVFIGVLEQLELANQVLAESTGDLRGDVIYDGDILKWRKVINSFTLKVLISLSNRQGDSNIDIAGKFKGIIENPDQYPLFTSNKDNLQLEFSDKGGERYPFWNASHSQYPHLDSFLVELLKEREDRRLFFFASPTGKSQSEGLAPNNFEAYNGADGTAAFETIVGMEADKNLSKIHKRYSEDAINEPYVRMGYAEQQFNIAEAAARGWISVDPSTYYNQGIKASMEFYRDNATSYEEVEITDAYIANYLTNEKVVYDPANGVAQILTQKFIASFLNSGWTTYYDYRRTGLPALKINPATSLNEGNVNAIPKRWKYPQKELDYNSEHVKEAIKRQYGEDDVNASMWLIK